MLDKYLNATGEDFTKHPVANHMRHDFRDAVKVAVGTNDRLIFKGSAGQGTWSKGPWVGIFDPLITSTPQSGYYPVYLFREDMAGVYLSLNQGMTEAKKLYKSDAKTALRARAQNYRAMLGPQISAFPDIEIDLAPSSPSNDTAFYEAGNICAKFYPKDNLPNETQLQNDLTQILLLYEAILEGDTSENANSNVDDDQPQTTHFEDGTKFRLHKRIERNSCLSKAVKKIQGCICKVCGIDFEKKYGSIGKGFIEAHHLKPIAQLKGTKVTLDPSTDFTVLCSNCHRMVHRSGYVDDIERFRLEHYLGQP